MQKRERLAAAVRGEPTDRPLVALWRHFPTDDQDPQQLAQSAAAFQQAYDWDFLKLTPAGSYSVEDWGARTAYHGHPEGTGDYVVRPVRVPEDWAKLTQRDPHQGALGRQLQAIRLTRALVGPDVPVIDTVFSPLAQAKHLASEATLLIHLRRHREAVLPALALIAESTARYVRASLAAGADGIFFAVQLATATAMSAAEYRELARALDLEVLAAAQGASFNLLHLHGRETYFDLVADYPVHALNWHDRETGPSLAEGAARFPGMVVGGLSQADLVEGTPGSVRQLAHAAIASLGGRRLCLSTGCVMQTVTPWGNMRALRTVFNAV